MILEINMENYALCSYGVLGKAERKSVLDLFCEAAEME